MLNYQRVNIENMFGFMALISWPMHIHPICWVWIFILFYQNYTSVGIVRTGTNYLQKPNPILEKKYI